ncbi:MAG: 4-(cytidine 5'-diphospho)-2-C-methyl-D-erythritol kinase [Oscillospiraceae bacterium]
MKKSLQKITLLASAKLNLSLDITGVRQSDGYHLMDMINRSVDLCDEISIETFSDGEFEINTNSKFLPRNEKNLAYKAAAALCEHCKIKIPPMTVSISKRIPTKAGLGGGSADAAAVLVGLNELIGLGMTTEQLCSVGEKIGADVPFCIVGGAARVTGIGEIIEPIDDICSYKLVIVMPRKGRSTRDAFAEYNSGKLLVHPDTAAAVAALERGDINKLAESICNVFGQLQCDETTQSIVSFLINNKALAASLTGSGAAVFGLFSDYGTANDCKLKMIADGMRAYVAKPCRCGVQIISRKS